MALLLNDCGIVWGTLITARVNQQLLQLGERGHIHTRSTCHHSSASHRIEHPYRHGNNHAGRTVRLHEPTRCPLFDAANADLAAKIRMPSVMDFQLLSDMGRMNG
jgi:hypothetical protein